MRRLRPVGEGEVKGMMVVDRARMGGRSADIWRVHDPIIDYGRCTACALCSIYCPEAAVTADEGRPVIDLRFCKGCGICAEECPVGAIRMGRAG